MSSEQQNGLGLRSLPTRALSVTAWLSIQGFRFAQLHAREFLHELGDGRECSHGGASGVEHDYWVLEGLLVSVFVERVGVGVAGRRRGVATGRFLMFITEVLRLLVRLEVIGLFLLALSILILDLIQSLHRLDTVEVAVDSGCFPINLVERQTGSGIGLGRYRRGGRILSGDLFEHV